MAAERARELTPIRKRRIDFLNTLAAPDPMGPRHIAPLIDQAMHVEMTPQMLGGKGLTHWELAPLEAFTVSLPAPASCKRSDICLHR